ncbi:uncharacterized protein L969DRAFT_84264 [Mixia osmundae IAM 14324]|uniref:uncharacterized protein n=1 Tax=Mixia osmundae (strain CBS 9802 / IAM 14324 / JCM 22182 / KY 12970) TaxID=764103 RepID=UPI0004A558F9|nr:uncharacterized protein L969DRAFT_84264 [Mixia osmundae IAM 14324]KEI42404.1 hypothetical protein L969DRAFT_84264 [Mixia osmundae IAM 14324]
MIQFEHIHVLCAADTILEHLLLAALSAPIKNTSVCGKSKRQRCAFASRIEGIEASCRCRCPQDYHAESQMRKDMEVCTRRCRRTPKLICR